MQILKVRVPSTTLQELRRIAEESSTEARIVTMSEVARVGIISYLAALSSTQE